ncbi:MAG: hypothetical protein ABJB93_02360 [Gaiellales bacterium]
MSTTSLSPLPAAYRQTTEALHRLAVYVIAPAQRLANGEINLRATPGGFSTFSYHGHVVGVDGDQLVVDGTRSPITTLNAAATAVGITPDVAQQEQFDVPPHGDLDDQLAVDAESARALGDWYAFATEALDTLRAEANPGDDASIVRIWPEHFDAAIDMGDKSAQRRGTYGASPGDNHHAEPYIYVSPWAGRIDDFFDDPTFKGASLLHSHLVSHADPMGTALSFLRDARDRIQHHV